MRWQEWVMLGALALSLGLLLWLLLRQRRSDGQGEALQRAVATSSERLERELRDELVRQSQAARGDLATFQRMLLAQSGDVARTQNEQIDSFRTQLGALQQSIAAQAQSARDAQDAALKRFGDALNEQMRSLSDANERRVTEMRTTVEQRLAALQDGNEKKLEQMRATVDEKLHATLEQRLGESFKQVTDHLQHVHNGLRDMQNLARDVGSLSRALTNVKSRGVFGERQLAALIEEVFTPDQYAVNVETVPGSNARVDFAIKLPGRGDHRLPLWLPIDCKFPREDYERLLDAQENADRPAAEIAAKAIELSLRREARSIREKYIAAPHTTDFGILFVPIEGLYAEALRRPGLFEALQREHHVTLAGPTTLLATLTSLQMGFRTLALEQRSAEVWEVLGAVKTEFAKFGEVLAKTKRKLDEASKTIGDAEVRTRVMAKSLRDVEALPDARAQALLPLPLDDGEEAPGP